MNKLVKYLGLKMKELFEQMTKSLIISFANHPENYRSIRVLANACQYLGRDPDCFRMILLSFEELCNI